MMKEEVRQIAEREHLINAKRKDSQGICFLGKINYNDYVKKYLGENPGLVIDIETGKKIGMHKGLWFHTIGQRHGLGFGGGPWFAVKKNIKKNILFVSRGYNPESAYRQEFKVHDINWLTAPIWEVQEFKGVQRVQKFKDVQEVPVNVPVTIKIRHTSDYIQATISPLTSGDVTKSGSAKYLSTDWSVGSFLIRSSQPIHGVAPGQFCTIYDADHHRCFGSGEIFL